jgi:resolvase domain protein
MFLQVLTYNGFAKALTAKGIKTPGGKDKWSISTVRSILSNEKYKGDALLQKRFTVDYLTKKQKKNEGEIPQYYVEGNHEAIIPPEKFNMVQREMAKRGKGKKYHSGVHPFSSKIKCGQCGSWHGSKIWHSSDKYRRVIRQRNHKYDGGKHCGTPHLTDEQIQDAFLSAANKLLATKDAVITNGREMMVLLFDATEPEAERDRLLEEAQVVSNAVQQHIYENAHVALVPAAYNKKHDSLTSRYEQLKTRIEDLNDQIQKTQAQKAGVEDFLAAFEKMPESLSVFSLDAFNALTDYLTVNGEGGIDVTFRNGQTIRT